MRRPPSGRSNWRGRFPPAIAAPARAGRQTTACILTGAWARHRAWSPLSAPRAPIGCAPVAGGERRHGEEPEGRRSNPEPVHRAGLLRGACHRAGHFGPDPLARNDDSMRQAALRFAVISLRLIKHSAIWMALSAAPLRKLSETTHIDRPFSTVASSRMRLM